jgi:lipopolysaccharide transport system ATP-binding protein
MSDIAVRVDGLSKQYRIGGKQEGYRTLRETITDAFISPFRRAKKLLRGQAYGAAELNETIWALRGVSLEIKRGEVVGIIGRNGAGKTTLLKILSRITEPTEGQAEIHGRVGSLLEVGTGFHPELTGRENIYLNGAILGMRKSEINNRFDEIVTFAEVEKFLDTPVKHYSSGMYVRLAFAVAAHMEPDILLVDEVLAVGDTAFQKKCLGKMGDVAQEGRTVFFVSHSMLAVQRLCRRVILFSSGSLEMDGAPEEIISAYLYGKHDREEFPSQREFDVRSAPGDDFVRLRQVRLVASDGISRARFNMDEKFSITIQYEVLKPISHFHLYTRVHTQDGILAFCSADWDERELQETRHQPGKYKARLTIPPHLLNTGSYLLTVVGVIPAVRFLFEESPVLMFQISSVGGVGGTESIKRLGIFRPRLEWSHEALD